MTPCVDPHPIRVTSASAGPVSCGGGTDRLNSLHLAHALIHHGAALGGVGVLVADEHAVFVVLVARDDVGEAGDSGDGARGYATVGDLVAFVLVRAARRLSVISSPRSISGLKSRSWDRRSVFLPRAADRRARCRDLEAVGDVEDFRHEREAIADIERRGNDARIVAECCAEHLPQVALFGFGGHAGGRTCTLTVDHDDGNFIMAESPRPSVMSAKPPPEVAHMERTPAWPHRWRS